MPCRFSELTTIQWVLIRLGPTRVSRYEFGKSSAMLNANGALLDSLGSRFFIFRRLLLPIRKSRQPEVSFVPCSILLKNIAADIVVSILVHPLTSDQRGDHETRNAWMGTPWPIFLDGLPVEGEIPLQYPELGLGWSTSPEQEISLEERRRKGAELEALLENDPEAAPAPKYPSRAR